jgi:two-component system, NtrC family, response regulator GlrR
VLDGTRGTLTPVSVESSTLIVTQGALPAITVPLFRMKIVAGPDAGAEAVSEEGRMTVGTAEGATLRLSDPTVSRFHAELEATPTGIAVRDLGSTNGTLLGAAAVREVVVRGPVELDMGRTRVRLLLGAERASIPTAAASSLGGLLGGSAAMRAVFDTLERAAPTTAPVLLTGESGTGKELAARAVHAASPRAAQPFEVVDCGGLPPTLIESELFGHERGSFTGATADREGAFERAEGGTLFLDELGELPLELQPKLLRALGEREIRRVGGKRTRRVDVRVVAATNRDLRREVNAARFRADLYYRLAVIQVRMPPLRDRLDDLPLLVRGLLETIARDRGLDAFIEPDQDLLDALGRHTWPGNVRELRNYLEQLLILRVPPPFLGEGTTPAGAPGHDPRTPGVAPRPASFDGLDQLPLRTAKSELVERFERFYVEQLLRQTGGNVAEAARRAGVDRVTLFRTIRRHGLRGDGA